MHHLKPVYTPCSWSIDPAAESEDTPESRAIEKQIAEQMADVIRGRCYDAVAASVPTPRRASLQEIMGEEYVEGMTADQLQFIGLMLKP